MTLDTIKSLLHDSKSHEAIDAANELLASRNATTAERATAYYLRGNAYRQLSDMRMAMNSYLEARELDPDGPAAMAYDTIQEILGFYHKDLYNP